MNVFRYLYPALLLTDVMAFRLRKSVDLAMLVRDRLDRQRLFFPFVL